MQELTVGCQFSRKNKDNEVIDFLILEQYWQRSLINGSCTKYTIILNEKTQRITRRKEKINDPEKVRFIYE